MAESHSLPGRIPEEPPPPVDPASDEAAELAADDRVYVQDDRDRRRYLGAPSGRSDTVASLMVRIGVPGGRLSGDQLLATLDVCDELGGGTLRATSRQALQIHFVPKRNIREVLRRIDGAGLTTRATNGDVRRNVMCCPAPYRREPVHDQMQWLALRLSEELAPRPGNGPSDGAAGAAGSADGGGTAAQVDPLYGKARLPHRFNVGIGLPGDNCVDLYAQDAGLLAICENFNVVGYNVLVGGGMGMTPGDENTFPALARPMAFTRPDQAIEVVKAVYAVHRDFGDRADRSRGRLKYLVAQWGVPKFKAQVEGYLGWTLPEPRPEGVWDVDDHVGWHEQGDGRWFYGLHLVNGRILDADGLRLKSALREICRKYRPAIALTPGHGILLCDVRWEDRPGVEDLLRRHGVKSDHEISSARRWSMACVALPTCSLAVTESERVLPGVIDQLEAEMLRLGLAGEMIGVRMTGCSAGCVRPYTAEIGLVGRSMGRYAIYLGGRRLGDRLAFLYRDGVALERLVATLVPVLAYFKEHRQAGETFGDFCSRKGPADLAASSGDK